MNNILLICLFIIFTIVLYNHIQVEQLLKNANSYEAMSDTKLNNVKDIDDIGKITQSIIDSNTGTLTIPGDLSMSGDLKIYGDNTSSNLNVSNKFKCLGDATVGGYLYTTKAKLEGAFCMAKDAPTDGDIHSIKNGAPCNFS